ncbi:BMP family ABC transporter substrate-binding protein [Radiobacillus kanasensis]|uniref:BMP family lipoprotein n=1 Tax=Radiobacillus kanasensis TaxID=2844358 RepID=UPI001E474EEA|nr:BMP family ABC transporter substrate-binding protein [Radiobacillus kanasensis]UFT98162.1 BMP family ABC transporter substrate-binding protein [Radiobacillus kanasensis]
MFNKRTVCILMITFILVLTGCANEQAESKMDDKVKIGVMLSDVGLGDQSFSDSAFQGLIKARNELNIVFDYRELSETETYEKGLEELVKNDNDVIIGLGYMVQEDLEKVAKKYPKKQFVIIDSVSELKNVTSITFKSDQGSYLAGVVAALTSKSNTIGFIGGEDVPLINAFADGFTEGAKSINPSINVLVEYAGTYGDDKLGGSIAQDMIAKKADVLFAAAGFTGVGVLKQAQTQGIYAIGVDSDQYFYAEKAVITSVLKKIDVAVFQLASDLVKDGKVPDGHIEFGIQDEGVGLAPLRVVQYSEEQLEQIEKASQQFAD